MRQRLSLAFAAATESDFEQASIVFAGGAGVILRYGGFTVLVDPGFLHHGDHVHLGYDLTACGGCGIASTIEQLRVDFVVLPHLRDGHPGRAVDRELDRRVPVLTTQRAASALRRKGFAAARGLAGWETMSVERGEEAVRVTSVPAPHPASFESFLPDAMGSVLEFAGSGGAVRLRAFVSGDSLVHGDLRELPRRPGVDLAFLPVGGVRVVALFGAAGERGTAVRLIAARFPLAVRGDHDEVESLEDFAAAVRRAGLEAQVDYVEPGDGYAFRPSELRGGSEDPPGASSDDRVGAVDAPDRTVAA